MSILYKSKSVTSKYRFFIRYLLSYTLIFLIPLIALSYFVFNYFFMELESEVSKNSYSNLHTISTIIDTKISELNRISYQILTSSNLDSNNTDLNNPLTGVEVIDLLKYSITANQFIYEVVYYTGEKNLLYSSSSSYSMDSFFGSIYKYQHWNQDEFVSTVNNLNKNLYRPSEEIIHNSTTDRFLTFIFPSIMRSGEKKAVIFLAKESEILKNLEKFPGNTVILDNDSNIIMSYEDKDYLKTQDFKAITNIPSSPGFSVVELNKEKYFVSILKSSETQWTYLQLIPLNEVYKNVYYIKSVFLYGISLIILLGGIIITFLTKFNYNPIKQLKSFAEEKLGKPINTVNELEAIKVTINNIAEDSAKLQEKISSSQPAVKEFILSNFLNGNFEDIHDFNKAAEEAGLSFNLSCYQVAIFHFNDISSFRKHCSNIINHLESHLPGNLEGYCKNDSDNNRIILILSYGEEEHGTISASLTKICNEISSHWKLSCAVGVGNYYNNIEHIGKSYIEASTAVDYRLVKGNNQIIYYSEIESYDMNIDIYPKQKIESIALCIRNGNPDRIKDIVDDILKTIQNGNSSLLMTRCICFDLINSLMEVVHDINKAYPSYQSKNFDLKALTEFDTIGDFAENVKAFCAEICEYIQAESGKSNPDMINKVCTYINENYHRPNFSIQNTADQFGMSLPNLSQYFKSRTGKTLSEYVNYLQMEKAKELLLTTNEPLQSIIERIGLYNTSNFIRKFRHEVGMTPGEFRNSQNHLS